MESAHRSFLCVVLLPFLSLGMGIVFTAEKAIGQFAPEPEASAAFHDLINSFAAFEDEKALVHGERLLRLYAGQTDEYGNGGSVVEDLLRRKKKGSFGKGPPPPKPEEFSGWSTKKKIAYLIDGLEEIHLIQPGQPAGIPFGSDWRVVALIELGEVAVPDLIQVLEKDERLTRTVHYWRSFAPYRTILKVREVALVAIMSIVQVPFFVQHSTGGNFTNAHKEQITKTTAAIRDFWTKHGKESLAERMMGVLADPESGSKQLRKAAYTLSHLGDIRILSTTMLEDAPTRRRGPNPIVNKFKNPTAAEAVLKAMQRDPGVHQKKIADHYLSALNYLGDDRIRPLLEKARRSQKQN
jgi:hypothetical protein